MADDFQYDVFLSHSAKDKAVVRDVAERLRGDGLRAWFDEWELRPGDSIPAKIEAGLEHSRVLVLCMSAQVFGSDWAQLEADTFRFRDPLNQQRRFIPLRLDDAPIKGSLAQFLYINWLPQDREHEYAKLLEACRPDGKPLTQIAASAAQSIPNPPAQQTHDLRISISPTRNRLRQLAQIRLFNAGQRPILVDSWFIAWNDKSALGSVKCEQGTLPIRLLDHERIDLLVDISDKPVEELKSLGVFDAEQRFWQASDAEVRRFIYVAKRHEPPNIDAQSNEPSEPSEVSIVVAVANSSVDVSKRLEVRFKNLGPHKLVPRSARVEWNYEPPRWMPKESGKPQIAEAGGSISLQLDGSHQIIAPNNEVVFFLGSRDPFTQPIVAVLANDVSDDQLRVAVIASQWQWAAFADEVPGAIREFARAVLHNMQ